MKRSLVKITRIRSRVVDLPLPAPFHPAWARGRNQTNILMVLVEVETDAGITGLGAAHAGPEAAICIERFIAPYFIGQDPTCVEALAAVLRDAEILGPPMYFMELPLWDIIGKLANLPVYKLWGGAQRSRDGLLRDCRNPHVGTTRARCGTDRRGGLSRDEAAIPQ